MKHYGFAKTANVNNFGLINYFKDFLSLFLPDTCVACGNNLLHNEKYICTNCLIDLPKTNFSNDNENPVAKIFWGRAYIQFASSFLYFQKGSRVQKIMHSFKYKGQKEIGILLGQMFAEELKNIDIIKTIDYIVPVPLYWKKLKKRGYNQSEYFALGLSKILEIPVASNALIRIYDSDTQTRKSKYQRWENVSNIFVLENPAKFFSKHVLIVDDVITTGATLEACANEFLKYKENKVSIATIAMANF